jgi:sulfhydrogenase subunit beta (sulfur reductase)
MLRLEREGVESLIRSLTLRGYTVIGPTVRDSAVVYDEIHAAADLPRGWSDEQQPAAYRLYRRGGNALFGYNAGPNSWKQFLFPPTQKLLEASRSNGVPEYRDASPRPSDVPKYAFFGVRPCELSAILIQDAVFLGQYVDTYYKAVRERLFIVAVNCSQAGGTCFCTSMRTGPAAQEGFDLVLTEILEGEEHYFVADYGGERGAEFLRDLPHREAEAHEVEQARRVVRRTAEGMSRSVDTEHVRDILLQGTDDRRWDTVARRCLTCANCTLVCPTCFCATVEDVTDLSGENAERTRRWDSCFTMEFSYIHGGSIRVTPRSRYRQWLSHKFSYWVDQFGTFGCVGCGRCITWCPVGIDITEELHAIQNHHAAPTKGG